MKFYKSFKFSFWSKVFFLSLKEIILNPSPGGITINGYVKHRYRKKIKLLGKKKSEGKRWEGERKRGRGRCKFNDEEVDERDFKRENEVSKSGYNVKVKGR